MNVSKSGRNPGGAGRQMGGCDYKSKGGKVAITGTEAGKGTVGNLPNGGGEKIGQSFYEGRGAGKGIPSKKSGNTTSEWASKHD